MTDDDERDKDGYAYPIQVNQDITIQQQTGSHSTRQAKANYKIHTSGVLRKANIVDTTGAGDAFIGAYILSQLCSATDDNSRNGSEDTGEDTNRSIQFSLDFASWVAGKKLGGPGGRVAVPSGEDIDHELGTDLATVRSNLLAALSSFGGG